MARMGKPLAYDPDKVKALRMRVISLSLDVLEDKRITKGPNKGMLESDTWSAYKKELVMKIAPRVLPVLNAGREDGERLIPPQEESFTAQEIALLKARVRERQVK